jgi:DNA polymerase-3 subunit epsilon
MLNNLKTLFLDFQTTGAKPASGEILEIAWATGEGDAADFLIKPQRTEVSHFIKKMMGLNAAMIEKGASLTDAVPNFVNFYESYKPDVVVIHYAKFEQPFLEDIYSQFGFRFECPVLCTHEIAKRIYPNLPARGVSGLAGYFGLVINETKRGRDHVEATKVIWNGLIPQLQALQLNDLKSVTTWLQNSKPAKKTKYEYPLDKKKRLELPLQPGIYRMLGKNGEVLYVGKASSLRNRVNSYFRGQKKRNSFKLQMLAQVWDIGVTVCDTPLEAALLESDEIKKWSPRYNIALKSGEREVIFYNRSFMSAQSSEDAVHRIGPFSNRNVLAPLIRLAEALTENSETPAIPDDLMFEEIDTEILKAGFRIFCESHSLNSKDLASVRYMLSLGMRWYREYLKTAAAEKADQASDEDTDVENTEDAEVIEADETEREYTADEVAEKFQGLLTGAASALYRSKKLKKLFNCEIDIIDTSGNLIKTLSFCEGSMKPKTSGSPELKWSIATYDRLSVLHSEAKRLDIQVRPVRPL